MKRTVCLAMALVILLCSFMTASFAETEKWEMKTNSKKGETYRINKLDVTLKKAYLRKIDGIYNVLLEIDFKNNSKKDVYFEEAVSVFAFQGEEWLEENYDEETAINKLAKAAPGKAETYLIRFMLCDPKESIKIHLDAAFDTNDAFDDRVFSLSLKNADIKDDEVYNEEEFLAKTLALLKTEKPVPKDLKDGELLSVNVNKIDDIIVVKAKISPKSSKKLTILQNFANVEYMVKNYNIDEYSELQYWAVADMTSGDESKVISFDVPQKVLKQLKEGKIQFPMIQDYAKNFWLHPSLR